MRPTVAGCACLLAALMCSGTAATQSTSKERLPLLIERDAEVAKSAPGPHDGGGETTQYSFFEKAPKFGLGFLKRALHKGAAIGYHQINNDEVFYILAGSGELTLDGKREMVGASTAILVRPGNWLGLRQAGAEDLVIAVAFTRVPRS